MSNKENVEDPLKPLDEIYQPDERQKYLAHELVDDHARLSEIILSDSAPIAVRQLFETAKNLSLYSWFVYRFHQVSELIAFSALEMALRERYIAENLSVDPKDRPRGLNKFLLHAKSKQWISNEGFPSLCDRAKNLAAHKKSIDMLAVHDFEAEPEMLVVGSSEEEIQAALSEMDFVEGITKTAHHIRNDLAHGSSTLHPHSISTLVTVSELINQIFQK